ncbi:hypothetical protein JTE90_017036 [Oedothorax gibbosus]|uniref:glutathione-specific gamma-glutamylcyclotransferase n=1 Tax=Oedothorax gibbosus TaxID=931172 RepID=A0AAV6ULK0_9ARAC|nr:hypothetical protein JTE90_017036 [Oedothorax gibbosus]
MWKTDFPYERKVVGYIKGYMRRFWQASEDHRGIPGVPGRVVTIVPSSNLEDQVYGVAYKIAENDIPNVVEYLDHREKQGYQQNTVTFHPTSDDLKPFQLVIYIAETENSYYLGPAPLETIARQISKAIGPSGRNDDYLFQLANAMRKLAPQVNDCHLYELEELVKEMQGSRNEESGL